MPKPTVPTSGSSNHNPDEQMSENDAVRDIYRHEMNRLKSFSGWKSQDSAAPTMLAKAGFFYTAQGDTVECFICRVKINQWKMSDDPIREHKVNSPGCIFVHGGDSGNVPLRIGEKTQIPEVQRRKPESKPEPMDVQTTKESAFNKELEEKIEAFTEKYHHSIQSEKMLEKLGHLIPPGSRKTESPRKTAAKKTPYDERPILNLNVGHAGSLSRSHFATGESYEFVPDPPMHMPGEELVESASLLGTTRFSDSILADAFPYGDQTRALTIAQIQTELRSGPQYSGASERCNKEELIGLVQSANCPEYALIKKRMESFHGWTYSQNVDPKKLAEAGFFSSGESDRVRCFHCNGGLCNWQKEDIPWYEHFRWFGQCPYVLKSAKNEVVKATITTAKRIHGARAAELQKHHHHHGSGRTQCDPADLWQTDNMKRLLSMGFTRGNIQTVISKKGSTIVNDIEKMIDILDKPVSASVSRPAPALSSPAPASPNRATVKQPVATQRHQGEELISAHICQVCRVSKVSLMFMPCRHLVACTQCGIRLSLCPFCHKKVQATSKVEVK